MRKVMQKIQCPSCQKVTEETSKFKPFCSKRCREADLLGWLNGEYVISRPITEEDLENPQIDVRDREQVLQNLFSVGQIDPYSNLED
ncbi:MAG: DNA gyrase inhibitor YacG [Waddliaceae bacterium]|nr:DNA gyrase inhibitor YacG [Waddliaceae bacterium]